MKKVLINKKMSNIPAFLFFSTTQPIDETINDIVSNKNVNSFKDNDEVKKDGNFTRCQLAVFYEGETPDHRYFPHSFSVKLKDKLPYTPVVAYYDPDKEDFVGHNKEQQIYGIVDPTKEGRFVTLDDGNKWCICDVVLYTDRPDMTGKIASKIVGHKQSLELNADTLKYRVNYDENKHFKNFEFIDGDLLGVSVLGADEKPAFTGSQFFTLKEGDEIIRQKLIDYCLKEKEEFQAQMNGDKTMDIKKFMELSWGEISTKVDAAVCNEYYKEAYCYMIDMYSDSAIFRFSSNIENKTWLMRIYFSVDEAGNVTLGRREEVRVTYEVVNNPEDNANYVSKEDEKSQCVKDDEKAKCATEEEKEKSECIKDEKDKSECKKDDKSECKEEKDKSECIEDEKDKSECVEDEKDKSECKKDDKSECKEDEEKSKCIKDDEKTKCTEAPVVDNSTTPLTEPNPSDNSVVEDQPKAPSNATLEEPKNEDKQEINSGTSSFSSSEREEFESLKREKKINLINSYKEYLSADDLKSFTDKVDSFSDEKLELELLKKYKEYTANDSKIRVFSFSNDFNQKNESSLESFIKRNL